MASINSKATINYTVRTGPGTVQVDPSTGGDSNWSINLQPDGKILVGGESFKTAIGYPGSPGDESYGTRGSYTAVRLNADQQNLNHASKPTKNHLLPTLAATVNEQSLLNCVENFKDTLRTFVTAHYCLAIGSFLSEQSQAQHNKSGPAYSIDDSLRLHGHKTSCNRTEPMYTQHQSDIPCDL